MQKRNDNPGLTNVLATVKRKSLAQVMAERHRTEHEHRPRRNDRLNRRFADRLRDEYVLLTAALKGFEDPATHSRYASLLLHRLMFLYFIQARGLLAGDRRYLQNHLALASTQQPGGNSFSRYCLYPLFAGANPPGSRSLPLTTLFIAHQDQLLNSLLALPDAVFDRIFTLFDEFHWCFDLSAGSQNVITPDVLGALFEQEISPKEMGAYYTPSDITDYIARNTLVPALITRVNTQTRMYNPLSECIARQPERYIFPANSVGTDLPLPPEIAAGLHDVTRRHCWQQPAPPDYALPGETWREVIARRTHVEEVRASLKQKPSDGLDRLITWNLDQYQLVLDTLRASQQPAFLETFYQSLRSLAILDPTCGSGAFLLATIPFLETLSIACLTRMQELLIQPTLPDLYHQSFQSHLTEAGETIRWPSTVRNWISQHNLYGVDLMEEAVEICRLRLFLKVVAALPGQYTDGFAAQFGQHICIGNSLSTSLTVYAQGPPPENNQARQPAFSWYKNFPQVMKRGGFDVVIGNPPYVEYERIKQSYTVDGYTTLESGNLYALTMERSLNLLVPGGKFGMIVPASATCTDGYRSLQKLLLAQQELHIASFSDQRGRLFALPHPRLCIIFYTRSLDSQTRPGRVFTTPYLKTEHEKREQLFAGLRYTEVTRYIRPGIIPRYGSQLELAIQSKLARQAHCLEHYLCQAGTYTVYYTRKLSWFVQITPFIPLILNAQGDIRAPSELKTLRFSSYIYARIAFAVLNSNLFYWWLSTGSDCRNLNMREVKNLPLDLQCMSHTIQQKLEELATELENSLRISSLLRPMHFKKGGLLNIQCLYPARSKHLIDEIDRVLADHYYLSSEEIDFLLHYDGKYRQARQTISGDRQQ